MAGDDLPFAYGTEAPDYWSDELEDDPDSELTGDQCIIRAEHFFVRGIVRLPVAGEDDPFEWGVWVSLSAENFFRMSEAWEREGREDSEPMFGWLSTQLPIYGESTLSLKTMVHTQPVGYRPLIELEATDHPLAVEQRDGITRARVQEIAEAILHS